MKRKYSGFVLFCVFGIVVISVWFGSCRINENQEEPFLMQKRQVKRSGYNSTKGGETKGKKCSHFKTFGFYKESVVLDNVPESLHFLFDGKKTAYSLRFDMTDLLKNNLSDMEIKYLLRFICSEPSALGMTRRDFNAIGDRVINKLKSQNVVPEGLIVALIGMFYDENCNFEWRDYCLQHLGILYSTSVCEKKRGEVLQLFKDAIEHEMPGTALIAVSKNVGQKGISKKMVVEMASGVAFNKKKDDANRLTAMLVAAELNDSKMLNLAYIILDSKTNSVHFKMASLATIGMLGGERELKILSKYVHSGDLRLRKSSEAAVKKIEQRRRR